MEFLIPKAWGFALNFFFLVPTVSFRVSESVRKVFDLGSIEKDGLNEGFESRLEVL